MLHLYLSFLLAITYLLNHKTLHHHFHNMWFKIYRQSIDKKVPWSWSMDVQVMTSETCQTMGDVMREIDAAAIIRSYFILTGVNSITNIPFASMLEQHKYV